MKTFVCVKRSDQTFDNLPGEKVFLFPFIDSYASNNFAIFAEKIKTILAEAGPNDIIVFNGPTFISAIAGFFWFSDEKRDNYNVARWDVHERRYIINTSPMEGIFDA